MPTLTPVRTARRARRCIRPGTRQRPACPNPGHRRYCCRCGEPTVLGEPLTPAQQALVASNGGLVGLVMRRYSSCLYTHEAAEDLKEHLQDCLIRAAGLFDASRGFQFSTYATAAMIQEAQSWFARRVEEEAPVQLSRIEDMGEEGSGPMAIADPTLCDPSRALEVRDLLARCQKAVPAKVWRALVAYYRDGATMVEIAAGWKPVAISKERIRQVLERGLRTLRGLRQKLSYPNL